MTSPNRLQIRRGTAANWTAVNPTLSQGEPALEVDTGKTKIGDGSTAWSTLPYQPNTTDLNATYAPASGSTNYAPASGSANYAARANNLSDLASAATARTNLGLGDAATHPASDFSGSAAGTAGKPLAATDASTTNPRTPTAHASSHGNGGADQVSLDASQVASGAFGVARIPDLSATYAPQWKPLTAYTAGYAVLNPSGDIVTAKTGFTSGASYSAANWNLSASYQARGELVRNVKDAPYGAKADGTTDDATAIQNAINDSAAEIISSNMKISRPVLIPGGVYKTGSKIVQPPYVKVYTEGTVIIESYVASETAWHVTPLSTDPANLFTDLQKEQWMRGAIINGSHGGFILVNKTGSTTGTTGLECGSRTNISRDLARYRMCDVAIQGYGVGQQINTFNHYIAAYENFHIESNTTDVQIGNGALTVNSGENFNWTNTVFAGATTAVYYNADSFNTVFTNCSFDFLNTALLLNKGYMRIMIHGGHIENINQGSYNTSTGGIVVSNVSTGVYPDVLIRGLEPFVTGQRNVYFRGNMQLWVELQFRSSDYTNMGSEVNWLCDDLVNVRQATIRNYSGMPRVAKSMGLLRDPVLAAETAGTAAASLANYAVTSVNNAVATVAADGPRSGAQSLKWVITGSGYLVIEAKDYIPCVPGDNFNIDPSYKFSATPYPTVTARGTFFDSNKVMIGSITDKSLFRTNTYAAAWSVHDSPQTFVAPAGAAFFRPGFEVSTGSGDGVATYQLSDFHVFRN